MSNVDGISQADGASRTTVIGRADPVIPVGNIGRGDIVERRSYLLHPALVAAGSCLLITTFVTDALYFKTLLFQWDNFSAWLLLAGLVIAGIAGIAFFVDLLSGRLTHVAWLRVLGLTIAALLSLLNAFVHSRDSYTAVVPEGITLSAIAAIILLVVGWGGWTLGSRRPLPLTQHRESLS